MDILLVEKERLVRDQVKVGLQQFPEFTITVGEGYAAINELRQRQFDCIFVGAEGKGPEGLRLLKHLRSFDRNTEVVVIANGRAAKDLATEKSRLNITSFLTTPIDATEFFRLVARLRARRQDAEPAGRGR